MVKKEEKKRRGISGEVNWDVFRSTVALYIASAWLCALSLQYFTQKGAQTTTGDGVDELIGAGGPSIFAVLMAVAAIAHSFAVLKPAVSVSEIVTTMILGLLFGLLPGLLMSGVYVVPLPLLLYGCSVSIAHLFEYLFVCGYHCDELDWESFLINQSTAYIMAHCFALAEYAVEYLLVPSWLKLDISSVPAFGFGMLVIGHFFRIGAMFTAAQSFHHKVQYEKADSHVLVTSGVYQLVRHPSYFGWTLWAVGTQVMLVNPVSTVGFIGASFMFFKDRIPYEEELLVDFFGEAYIKYALKTPIGLPFIESFIRESDFSEEKRSD